MKEITAACILYFLLTFCSIQRKSDSTIEEAISSVLLLKDKDEGDLIDCIVFKHVLIPRADDLFGLIHTDDFEGVVEVCHGDLLDLKHVVRVENGLEVLRGQKLRLELVERIVMWVCLIELLTLDRLEHFEDRGLGIDGLLIQDVGHQFL